MHVDAVGAAVDLRGANLHELDQARLEAGGDRERSAGPDLHDVGGGGEEINLGSHWTIPFMGSDDMTSRGPPIVTSPRKNLRRSDLSLPVWRAMTRLPQSTDETRTSSAQRWMV